MVNFGLWFENLRDEEAEFVSFTWPTAFRLDRLVGAFSTTYVSKHLGAPGVSAAKLNWNLNQMHKREDVDA